MKISRSSHAFTLLEVLIAMGLFFIAVFSILQLVSQNLRAVYSLRPTSVDVTMVMSDLMLTNKVEEGMISGDFGDLYPGYTWTRDVYEVSSNGLFQVDVLVMRNGGGMNGESRMSMLLYKPESTMKAGSGGFKLRSGGQP